MATHATAPQGDPVGVDANHYTIELKNGQVRVLRVRFAQGHAGSKAGMAS